ncbi:MAG: sulfite exporter TauE/SafE family protein [Eubacteriales bacterium]|nr:sulfite exporter TauE/SafE family protein [Eubacteriales bacterium]
MANVPVSITYSISGMTCSNCSQKISKALNKQHGVIRADVQYELGQATILYDPDLIEPRHLIAIIEKLGYQIRLGSNSSKKRADLLKTAGIVIGLVLIYQILSRFGVFNFFNNFPLAEQGMGYGMLLLIGVLTSVHCIAMCGAINLSVCTTQAGSAVRPSLLYNAGRVLSYTLIGGIVGALGAVISFTGALKGVVILLAGLFMVLMGINLLGLFPKLSRLVPHLPQSTSRFVAMLRGHSNNRPFIIGMLNGLMPCGPLQAMQLYALATASPIKGALSMFLFSLGTVPFMFALGAASTLLTQKFTRRMIQASSLLVIVLGLFMMQNGLALSGLPSTFNQIRQLRFSSAEPSSVENAITSADPVLNSDTNSADVQIIRTTLQPNAYEPITVQVGRPVRWIIEADKASLNGCNQALYVPEYDLEKQLKIGENVIEFTPTQTGVFPFSCWMGMIDSEITVVS